MPPLIHHRYEITGPIGEGGMGVVYRAIDTRLGRPVALKVIHRRLADSANARAWFLREARVAASLNHPNICTIHEVFDLGAGATSEEAAAGFENGPIIVMELLEGETLQARLARAGPLPAPEFIDIAMQVSDGLADAHARHVVHRDIKPHNILVGASGRVKILDFGLARAVAHAPAPDAETVRVDTVTDVHGSGGAAKGTVPYMSPEQAAGKAVDARSDIFSFGSVLYEMATGRRPFAADTSVGVVARILEGEPAPIAAMRPDLPSQVIRIVERCLRKKPEDRYQNTHDLAAELRALGVPRAPAVEPSRRRFVWPAIAGAAVVVAAIGLWTWNQTPPPAVTASHGQITFVGDASFPTISPDGTFLAYVRGEPWGRPHRTLETLRPQKIVVQDLAGGGRTLEVGECRSCAALAWSPDGATLLAADPPDWLFIPRLGGEVRRVTRGGRVGLIAWAPNGALIATAPTGGREITFIDPKTGEVARSDAVPGTAALLSLDWSPSGDRLALATASGGRHAIWLIAADGERHERLLEGPTPIAFVKWSAAGDAVYYLREVGETHDLMKLDVQPGWNPARAEPAVVLAGVQAGPNVSLARDGRTVFYTRELHYSNLWTTSVDPARPAQPPAAITSGTSRDQFPAVSPDGAQVAFVRAEGAATHLFVLPVDGSARPRQLTFQKAIFGAPAWSPDGSALAFCVSAADGGALWRVDVRAGTAREFAGTRCTNLVSEVPVGWSPLADILYQRSGNTTYHVLNPDSLAERPLVDASLGWIFGPRPSPDGSTAAFFWNRRGGIPGLWLVPLAGGDPSLLLKRYAWPLGWSQDGKTVYAYQHAPTADILAVPVKGGEPRVLRGLAGQRISLVPALSPDGRTLVYAVSALHSDVWRVDNFDPRAR